VKSNSIEYNKNIKELTMQESDVAKITRSRITSVFLHPTVDKILVAAGDKDGYVGLWDVDNFTAGNDGVYMYRIHNSNVTRLHCFQQDPWKIYSSSYDGTIRCLDVHANAFVVAFDAPDSDGNTFTSDCYFLSSNASCALIGKSDGQVALVDMRASNRTYQWEHFAQMQNAKINSVQEHPTESHLIVSAGSGKAGCLRVHDLRKAGKGWKPLVEMNEHSKSINAAYVSTNGEYLVSVALDDTVRTWRNFISPGVKPSCEVSAIMKLPYFIDNNRLA
jgi:WD40 repeat protein